MMNIETMKMREEIKNHLTEGIIPFWKGMRDDEFGGYYGYLDYDLNLDKKAERTTYTVGVGSCTPAPEGERSKECTLLVDMRSPTPGPLKDIRSKIEPAFAKALQQENAKYGLKDGDAKAVKMELVWFGDRPAHKRKNYDDPAMQAFWQSARTAGMIFVKN